MEESKVFFELKSISCLAVVKFMKSVSAETVSSLYSFSSQPLFSCIVTFCTMVLLYFPLFFWKIVSSPVLILAGIFLFTIRQLGAILRSQDEQKEKSMIVSDSIISEENRGRSKEDEETNSNEPEKTNPLEQVPQLITGHGKIKSHSVMDFSSNSCIEESFSEWNVTAPLEGKYEENTGIKEEENEKNSIKSEANSVEQVHPWITGHRNMRFEMEVGFSSNSCLEEPFTEWNVKAPLEVIYEEYEGEEEGKEDPNDEMATRFGIPGYPPLSLYYLESDSDSSSAGGFPPKGNWDWPENICFRYEEDGEGLIEIDIKGCGEARGLEIQFEEDNLIEIDISPTRYRELSGDNELFFP